MSATYHDIRQCSVSWLVETKICCNNSWKFDTNSFQATINLTSHHQPIARLFQLWRKRCLHKNVTTLCTSAICMQLSTSIIPTVFLDLDLVDLTGSRSTCQCPIPQFVNSQKVKSSCWRVELHICHQIWWYPQTHSTLAACVDAHDEEIHKDSSVQVSR